MLLQQQALLLQQQQLALQQQQLALQLKERQLLEQEKLQQERLQQLQLQQQQQQQEKQSMGRVLSPSAVFADSFVPLSSTPTTAAGDDVDRSRDTDDKSFVANSANNNSGSDNVAERTMSPALNIAPNGSSSSPSSSTVAVANSPSSLSTTASGVTDKAALLEVRHHRRLHDFRSDIVRTH